MDVMLRKISENLYTQNIVFEPDDHQVRCLAHIINLSAKKIIESFYKIKSYENENEFITIEDTEDNLKNSIYKVSVLKY
jgi:hypothetical protein